MTSRFSIAAVFGGLLAGAVLWLLLAAAGAGQDAKPAKQPEPERFQYIRSDAGSEYLLDSATGKVYVPTKAPGRKWGLRVEAPADLPAEAAKDPAAPLPVLAVRR